MARLIRYQTDEQEAFRRTNNDWFDANLPLPAAELYARPGAIAWFKVGAAVYLERVPGYLRILEEHGVAWQALTTNDPGEILYEDPFQVVALRLGVQALARSSSWAPRS